jgi:diguanylate cyclase (GGDEF)-like protein/PAS domain S-box-containing protein
MIFDEKPVAKPYKIPESRDLRALIAMQPGHSFRARPANLAVVILSILVYGFAAITLLPLLGPWFLTAAVFPVALAGWFIGPWSGGLVGGLSFLFHWPLLGLQTEIPSNTYIWPIILGALVLGALGVLLGLVRQRTKRAAELSVLLAVTQSLAALYELDEVLAYSATRLSQIAGVQGCTLFRWDSAADALKPWERYPPSQSETGKTQNRTIPLDELPTARLVLETGEPHQVRVSHPKANSFEVSKIRQAGFKSLLLLPLATTHQVIGLARLEQLDSERQFYPLQVQFLNDLADQIARRIVDTRHLHGLKTQLQETDSTGAALAEELNTTLEKLADQLRRAGNASAVLIYRLDSSNGDATFVQATSGSLHQEKPSNGSDPFSSGAAPLFLEPLPEPSPQLLSMDDPALSASQRTALQEAGVLSALLLPLQIDGQLVGAAELWNSQPQSEFSPSEIDACQKITPLAALALESTRIYRQAKEKAREQDQVSLALQESEERYALAARGSNDGLWDWNLDSSEIYFSPRWAETIGFVDTDLGNHPDNWFDRVHPDDLERLKVEISLHLEGFSPHFESEYRLRHRDGTFRWMLARGLAVRDENRKAYRIAGSQTDITERKQVEDQLRQNAFFDSMTQLPNRDLFLDRLSHAIERARRRTDEFFAVLFLDLDHFKSVNDRLGHDVGDQLLGAVSGRLKNCVRAVDTVARLGGDEFIILLEDLESISNTTLVAQRILAELEQPFHLGGHEAFITASIGIAFSSAGYERYEDLLRDADTAMYQAKAAGKAQYSIFETKMRGQAAAILNLEKDLRAGLARQEFCLHFQPIVSLDSGRVIGFEALLRWLHPERGLLDPVDFLSAAEETGLIIPIGQWVIQQACKQMDAWASKFPKDLPLVMSVNAAGEELAQSGFAANVERALQEFDLTGDKLVIEITERGLQQSGEAGLETLARLHHLGVQLHIDDFVPTEALVNRLPDLPVNTLKIDSLLVERLDEARQEIEPVQTIIDLAHELGMNVIAEGVESADQLTRLKQLHCNAAQGFFFSPPVDGTAIN